MITAVFRREAGALTGFTVSGHADVAEEGQDIVCAAVSACVELTANGVLEVLSLPAKVYAEGDTVFLRLPLDVESREAQFLLRALLLELEQIAAEYPDAVRVQVTEA